MFFGLGLAIGSTAVKIDGAISGIPYGLNKENADAKSFCGKEQVTIVAEKGTDFFISPDGLVVMTNTPRIAFEPKGDFEFSAKVSGQFSNPYDGAALFVLVDLTHWAKLLFERFPSGINGLGTLVTKEVSDDAHHAEHHGDFIYLKITRKGAVFSFYWSDAGDQWLFIRKFRMDATQPVKIGFTAQSPTSDRVTARFTELRFGE